MNIKLVTEHHLEFVSLKGGCTGSFESTLVKMSHCWKSHVVAHIFLIFICSYDPKGRICIDAAQMTPRDGFKVIQRSHYIIT